VTSSRDAFSPFGIARARGDDERERRLVRIMSENFDGAWLFARRLGVSEGDLDDVMQEVSTVTFQRLAAIAEGKERSFVFGTTFRVASEHRRRRARRREEPEELARDTVDPRRAPDHETELRDARALFDEILHGMPMDLRAALVLFEVDELEQTEIAEALDLPVGTVASRLRRARADFEARVARYHAAHRRRP
jgi:RNA polymerase sigma-70 factor, ECF subfamily